MTSIFQPHDLRALATRLSAEQSLLPRPRTYDRVGELITRANQQEANSEHFAKPNGR